MSEDFDPFAGTATNKVTTKIELIPPDNYVGRLCAIIDLGTHDDEYKGQVQPDRRSLCLAFELSGEKNEEGKVPVVCETVSVYVNDGKFVYTAKNKLRKILESMRGKTYGETEPINATAALGQPCMVNVTHKVTGKGKTIAVIDSVSKLPKGTTAFPPFYDKIAWGINMTEIPNLDHLPYVYAGSPKQMQSVVDVIKQSKEKGGPKTDTTKSESAKPAEEHKPPQLPSSNPQNDSDDDEDAPPF